MLINLKVDKLNINFFVGFLVKGKHFTDSHQALLAEAEILTHEIEQFPSFGANCNVDKNDDFAGTSFV